MAKKEFARELPSAVLIDLDNTLYDYQPAHKAAINHVKNKAKDALGLRETDFEAAYESSKQTVKARIGGQAASHSRLLYFQTMLESLGVGSQVLLALDFEQSYWRTFLANAVLFEGVIDFLDDLRLQGIPVALVTDLTTQIQFRKVVYLGLDKYLDAIVTSEETGSEKPEEAPFRLALEKLKVPKENVWMIGDDAEKDILGARNALNAITFQKIHLGVNRLDSKQGADFEFSRFEELRKFLRAASEGRVV